MQTHKWRIKIKIDQIKICIFGKWLNYCPNKRSANDLNNSVSYWGVLVSNLGSLSGILVGLSGTLIGIIGGAWGVGSAGGIRISGIVGICTGGNVGALGGTAGSCYHIISQ